MKSKKNRSFSKKGKKGGYFFSNKNKNVAPLSECDPNNLSSIKGSTDLHENYQKCCPKKMFGRKNSSPYCKQVDLNFKAALKEENDAKEYHGYEPDEINDDVKMPDLPPKKPWYKFRGGKTKKNRKYSKRNHNNKKTK